MTARRRGVVVLALMCRAVAASEDAEATFAAGLQAYTAEEYQRAVSLFEKAVRQAPAVSRYHHWLGKAYGRRAERANFLSAMGLAKKTRASFERAVELDPANAAALADLFEYYLEAPGILGGGEDKARAAAARLAKLNAAEGHRVQAALLAKRKDYEGAEKELQRALDLEPSKAGRYLDLASFLMQRGRYDEAEAMLSRAEKVAANSNELLFARGRLLALSKKDPQRARELLEQYLRLPRGPDDPTPSEVRDLLKKLPQKS